MWFKILGEIRDIEPIAAGRGVRERVRIERLHGGTRWRKLKGIATVELPDGAPPVPKYTGTRPTASGALR